MRAVLAMTLGVKASKKEIGQRVTAESLRIDYLDIVFAYASRRLNFEDAEDAAAVTIGPTSLSAVHG